RGGEVRQLLQSQCVDCHGGRATRGGLDLTTRENLLRGGGHGAAGGPGGGKKSRLYRRGPPTPTPRMPYKRPRPACQQVALVAAWIDAGAPYDRPLARTEQRAETWWSLRPVVKPVPPPVRGPRYAGWVRNPIDHFILAKLLEKGLEPAPPADRRTLIRRVTF